MLSSFLSLFSGSTAGLVWGALMALIFLTTFRRDPERRTDWRSAGSLFVLIAFGAFTGIIITYCIVTGAEYKDAYSLAYLVSAFGLAQIFAPLFGVENLEKPEVKLETSYRGKEIEKLDQDQYHIVSILFDEFIKPILEDPDPTAEKVRQKIEQLRNFAELHLDDNQWQLAIMSLAYHLNSLSMLLDAFQDKSQRVRRKLVRYSEFPWFAAAFDLYEELSRDTI